MLELLILFVLFERDLTTYGVRKSIIDNFGIFLEPSLGAVHPAIARLMKKGCITMSKNISEGGQKACYHHLTGEGKKYFYELFLGDFSNNAAKSSTQIKIKLAMLPAFTDKNDPNAFFETALSRLELHILDTKNFITDKTNESDTYVKLSAELLLDELVILNEKLQKLRAEKILTKMRDSMVK